MEGELAFFHHWGHISELLAVEKVWGIVAECVKQEMTHLTIRSRSNLDLILADRKFWLVSIFATSRILNYQLVSKSSV